MRYALKPQEVSPRSMLITVVVRARAGMLPSRMRLALGWGRGVSCLARNPSTHHGQHFGADDVLTILGTPGILAA